MTRQRLAYLSAGIILAVYLLLISGNLRAQNDQGYIYGKVTTIDDKEYIGEIRWGKEETFWDDIFNSTKERNPNLKYLDRSDYQHIRNSRSDDDDNWGNFWEIWEDKYSDYSHQFAARFGDFKAMEIKGRNDVEIEFKNGLRMDFEGGSNDLGAKIRVYDQEIGQIRLSWDRIDLIEFMETPKNLRYKYGEPLTGTVSTSIGKFYGMIQWDHEECLSEDLLDGDNEDGDISIPFGNIKSITRDGRGSEVVLKSGREMYLRGSNDVNNENRGVIVKTPEIGKIKISWREFDEVVFDDVPTTSGQAYSDYKEPKELFGSVFTKDGEEFSGRIIYDLDEEFDFELLNGKDEDIEFIIPFRNIKSIVPKNYNYSTIELRSGKKILLGDAQDVSDRHDGILVFENKEQPVYIPWDDVEQVVFK
ncbi:MAG: hypothetical protein AAF363_04765 [Bacteroidota bacterium]